MSQISQSAQTVDYDWTFTTPYRGTLVPTGASDIKVSKSCCEIDRDALRRPERILYFDELILYEDELADHGISILSVKIACYTHLG